MTEQSKEAVTEKAKLREEVLNVLETLGNNLCDFMERAEALREENEALIREADENAALAMQHKMRADDLAKENAALKERLEKAVELPVKVGDTVWLIGYIHVSADAHLQCVDAKITDIMMMKDLVRYGAQEGDWCHEFTNDAIGEWVFMTREAAEAKRAEMEEEDDEETDKS